MKYLYSIILTIIVAFFIFSAGRSYERLINTKETAVAQNNDFVARSEVTNDVVTEDTNKKVEQQVLTKVVTQKVIEYVTKPNTNDCRIDDDWLRIVNQAAGFPDTASTADVGARTHQTSDEK